MILLQILIVSLIVSALPGCGFFPKKVEQNPLCVSECPDLSELKDATFGATSEKLKEVADTYYNCRKACQPAKK